MLGRRCYGLICITLTFAALIARPARAQQPLWEQTNGPSGGDVTQLVQGRDGLLFALASGYVYRSADDGHTWTKAHPDDGTLISITVGANGALFLAPYSGLIPTSDCCYENMAYKAYRSLDDGNTWEPVQTKADMNYSSPGAFATGAEGRTFALARGLYKTDDAGETWDSVAVGTYGAFGWNSALVATGEGRVVLDGYYATYVSTDNGDMWKRYDHEDGLEEQYFSLLPDGTLFRFWNGQVEATSTDTIAWSAVSSPSPLSLRAVLDSSLLINAEGGSYISHDKGATWEPVGPEGQSAHTLLITGHGNVLAGTDAGVYRMLDWDLWDFSSEGIVETDIRSIAVSPDGVLYSVVPGRPGLFTSTDQGDTWELAHSEKNVRSISVSPEGEVYVCTYGEPGIWRLDDSGDLEPIGFRTGCIAGFGSDGSIFIWGSMNADSAALFRWDGGGNWHLIGLRGQALRTFAITPDGVMFACIGDKLYRSTDDGATWEDLSSIVSPDEFFYWVYAGQNEDVYVLTSYAQLYRSQNAGETWELLASLPLDTPYGLTLTDSYFFASIAGTILRSPDRGVTWERAGTGLPYGPIHLAADAQGNLYASTGGHGVYRSVNPFALAVEDGEQPVPPATTAAVSYPNPFRGQTTISFGLAHPGFATVKVYDLLGREVAVLVQGQLAAGEHTVTWDASGQPSGVYLYRVHAGDYSASGTMLLVK